METILLIPGLKLASIFLLDFTCLCPKGFEPDTSTVEDAQNSTLRTAKITNNAHEAVRGADVIYTDVWASMGQKEEVRIAGKIFSESKIQK